MKTAIALVIGLCACVVVQGVKIHELSQRDHERIAALEERDRGHTWEMLWLAKHVVQNEDMVSNINSRLGETSAIFSSAKQP
jgi:hypothetical protein